jgi:hypothetical protein
MVAAIEANKSTTRKIEDQLGETNEEDATRLLAHNFLRTMYQKLQNWNQGSKSIDEYTDEFHKLLTRVDLLKSDDQLVSRHIGGLWTQIQDMVNLFDPVNISSTHQRVPWVCLDVEEWVATIDREDHFKIGIYPHQTVQTKGLPLQGSLVKSERLPVSSVSDAVSRVIG